MTPQDYNDINILKHAARDILHELARLFEDSFDELDYVDIAEKGRSITRIAELIGAIVDNDKHLPYGEECKKK